jgi:hypothetical protein
MALILPKLQTLDHKLFSDHDLDIKRTLLPDTTNIMNMLQENSDKLLRHLANRSSVTMPVHRSASASALLTNRSQQQTAPQKPVPLHVPTHTQEPQQIYNQPQMLPQTKQAQYPVMYQQHIMPQQQNFGNEIPHYAQQYQQMPMMSNYPQDMGSGYGRSYSQQHPPWQQHGYAPNMGPVVHQRMPVYSQQPLIPDVHTMHERPHPTNELDHDVPVTQRQYKKLKSKIDLLASHYETLSYAYNHKMIKKQDKEKEGEEMEMLFPQSDQHYQVHATTIQRQWREYRARQILKSYSRLEFEHSVFKYRLRFEMEKQAAQMAMMKKLWEQTCVIYQNGWHREKRINDAAAVLQKNWRMYLCRRWYEHTKVTYILNTF